MDFEAVVSLESRYRKSRPHGVTMANHSTIKQRLLLLLVVPLISLGIFGGKLIADSYSEYRSAQRTQSVLRLAVAAGNLVHALQIERGATAGFLQSKGGNFSDVLPGIRAKTDEQRSAFSAEVSGIDRAAMPALGAVVKRAESALERIPDLRERAKSQQIPVKEHMAAYTGTISSLINIIASGGQFNSDATMGQQLLAYLSFVQAKEQAGQERALTTAAFSADLIEAALFRQILERHFRQEAYLDVFRSTAGKAENAAFEKVLGENAAKEVQSMRNILYEKFSMSGFKADPQTWFRTITDKIDAMLGVERLISRTIDERASQVVAGERNLLVACIVLTVLAMVVMLSVAAWVSASVSRPLKEEVRVAEYAIRENDFSRSVPEAGPAEVVRAGKAFNDLMSEFREIIIDVKRSSERISGAAHDLASSSQRVQESSASQSEAASAVAAAVQEASVSVSETASNAKSATDVVNRASQETTKAMAVTKEAVSTMKSIAELIAHSAGGVRDLSTRSEMIGGIVGVIREIADQTNLLALNAAIEAARAGESGRGFAVVADEVRKLAERTTKATSEISSLITIIQERVRTTASSMQEADGQATESLKLAGRAEEGLARISEGSDRVADCVFAISGALSQLDSAIREVAQNVERIAQMTEVNNSAAESNYSTARSLDGLSAQLRESVIKYQT